MRSSIVRLLITKFLNYSITKSLNSSITKSPMPLDPDIRRALVDRIDYYRELGIHDFYRREVSTPLVAAGHMANDQRPTTDDVSAASADHPDTAELLRQIRDHIGDCTRCRLHAARTNIVFGTGNPHA